MSARLPVKAGTIPDVVDWALPAYDDARGRLVETFREDDPPLERLGFKAAMSYISWTNPGLVRGFHAHPGLEGKFSFADREPRGRLFKSVNGQRDLFYFLDGLYRLVLFDARVESPSFGVLQEFLAGGENRRAVLVPSGVWHAYKNVCDRPAFVLNFPDTLFKGRGKTGKVDELREDDGPPFFDFNW
jgi:dTDP-4-dehydrorhamnose 3,5-epimerase